VWDSYYKYDNEIYIIAQHEGKGFGNWRIVVVPSGSLMVS